MSDDYWFRQRYDAMLFATKEQHMEELVAALAQDLSEQIILTPVGSSTEPYIRMARKLLRDGWFKVNDETSPALIAQFLIDNCTGEQIYTIRAALGVA